MDITIREAHEEDLPTLLTLYREAGLEDGPGLDLPRARDLWRKMAHYPDYRLFVAEVGGRLAGTFALLIMDNLVHAGASSGIVEDVAVHPSFQGRGIGKNMMEFARNRCAEQGCYKLVLSSGETRTGAHRFYESLGFTRHGFSFRIDVKRP